MTENHTMKWTGKTLSPGLGCGLTFVYRNVTKRADEFHNINETEVDQELDRLINAIRLISDELNDLASHVDSKMDSQLSDIFRAHVAMVQDASLQNEIKREIRNELVSAGTAVRSVFRRWEDRFHSMDTEMLQNKSDDVRDLAQRLVSFLAGVRGHTLENLPDGCILVAKRLLPSDTLYLARRNTAGAVLEVGGAASHAALFAREIGLPCIVGIPNVVDQIPAKTMALVDADTAEIIIRPTREQTAAFQSKREQRNKSAATALCLAQAPAVTLGGTPIQVFANVGGVDDTCTAIRNGADGVGLYRTEQAYLRRKHPPDPDILLSELQETLEPARGLPVYVRLLDAGADKPLPFMEPLAEANPSLGLRGIRLLKRYPELLQIQLDALLRLAADFDMHILVPMVTVPGDMQWVKDALHKTAVKMGLSAVPPLGAMIETPGAALTVRGMTQTADFLSFGTNDLTQYTFAADRENAAVDAYFDDKHPAIFRLLKLVHEDVPNMPLSVCGELASRPECIDKLLQCGITTFSVAPPLIPRIKQAIRQSKGIS